MPVFKSCEGLGRLSLDGPLAFNEEKARRCEGLAVICRVVCPIPQRFLIKTVDLYFSAVRQAQCAHQRMEIVRQSQVSLKWVTDYDLGHS